MTDAPVVSVWDAAADGFHLAGRITGYTSLTCEPHYLDAGNWSMTIPDSAPLVPKLTRASVVTIDWAGVRWGTGRVTNRQFAQGGDEGDSEIIDTFSGDLGLTFLGGMTCWPLPSQGIAGQGTAAPYWKELNVPAEDLVLDLIDQTFSRYGSTITTPTSQHRGSSISGYARFDDLQVEVAKFAKRGGIIVDVGLVNSSGSRATMVLSVRLPRDKTQTAILSQRTRSLNGWSFGSTRPTMTKAIVGGGSSTVVTSGTQVPGARVFVEATTPESVSLANIWNNGDHIEGFVDASNIDDPTDTASLLQAGYQALDEAIAADSFELDANTSGMKIWTRALLGDTITVELTNDVSTTDVLSGLTLSADADNGVTVTPIVGNSDGVNPRIHLGRLVNRARRDLRNIQQWR